VLAQFPNTDLATRLFTTIENGRIDFLLRAVYRGIRRDLDFVRRRLMERRPNVEDIPAELLPFELLFQLAICGGATPEALRSYPTVVRELDRILGTYVFREDATVADSLIATRHVYEFFVEQASQSDAQSEETGESGEGGQTQSDEASLAEPEQSGQRQQLEVRDDPFSLWNTGQQQDISPDQDIFNRLHGPESPEQDLEKGDRAFYYDEWDRELADYRTRWCRIIERGGSRGSRAFVELVRSRYAGVISSIRYQFQLMRPENLRRIRGEIDGEDYDLQAVIDYALDKRSTGLIDDRLYTRKLRRERDVAVSFLLDMSSSTARTITRYPNHPYTQPGQRIIDIEKEGLVLMSEALEAVGDAYSMQGFTSEGRRNVKFYVIKDFSEGYSAEVERRIGGISYQNNTRLGAAIRHATTRLARQDARTKLLIVLSDGRPYDHDYGDSRYAREDTRVALKQARIDGITPFCITIDRESEDQLRDMYGEVGYTIIDDVLSLPERLPGIYTRLTT
jgi:nitric oxide reductase activation protein